MQTEIDPIEWRSMYMRDSQQKLEESNTEYVLFKETGKIIYLQQASNKLFSACENMFMLKYGKLVRSYQQLRSIVKNRPDRITLGMVNRLHRFFYQSALTESVEDMQELYKDAQERVNLVYKSLK